MNAHTSQSTDPATPARGKKNDSLIPMHRETSDPDPRTHCNIDLHVVPVIKVHECHVADMLPIECSKCDSNAEVQEVPIVWMREDESSPRGDGSRLAARSLPVIQDEILQQAYHDGVEVEEDNT